MRRCPDKTLLPSAKCRCRCLCMCMCMCVVSSWFQCGAGPAMLRCGARPCVLDALRSMLFDAAASACGKGSNKISVGSQPSLRPFILNTRHRSRAISSVLNPFFTTSSRSSSRSLPNQSRVLSSSFNFPTGCHQTPSWFTTGLSAYPFVTPVPPSPAD